MVLVATGNEMTHRNSVNFGCLLLILAYTLVWVSIPMSSLGAGASHVSVPKQVRPEDWIANTRTYVAPLAGHFDVMASPRWHTPYALVTVQHQPVHDLDWLTIVVALLPLVVGAQLLLCICRSACAARELDHSPLVTVPRLPPRS